MPLTRHWTGPAALALGLSLLSLLASSAATAADWCSQSTVSITPASAFEDVATDFSFSVDGPASVTISSASVLFSWEAANRSVAGGRLPLSFRVPATPRGPGPWTATVRLTGTDGGPAITCEATLDIASSTQRFLQGLGLAAILCGIAGTAAVLVILAVYLTIHKKYPPARPTAAYPYPYLLAGPGAPWPGVQPPQPPAQPPTP